MLKTKVGFDSSNNNRVRITGPIPEKGYNKSFKMPVCNTGPLLKSRVESIIDVTMRVRNTGPELKRKVGFNKNIKL